MTLRARLVRRLPLWRGTLILTYHRIAARAQDVLDEGVWSATPAAFAEQMAWLARVAEVCGPDRLADRRRGRRVMVTFDDGYLDNRVNALPILLEHGLTATFFITTGFLDRRYGAWWDEIAWMAAAAGRATAGSEQLVERCKRTPAAAREAFLDDLAATLRTGRRPADSVDADWMTWDHVRELRGAGMTVGAHTVSHPLLGGLEAAEQRREIATSVGRVGAELGEPPALFALPDGREGSYDEHTLAALRASGVRRAFLNAGGVAGPRHAEPLLQPRFNVWRGISARHWRALLLAPRPVLRR